MLVAVSNAFTDVFRADSLPLSHRHPFVVVVVPLYYTVLRMYTPVNTDRSTLDRLLVQVTADGVVVVRVRTIDDVPLGGKSALTSGDVLVTTDVPPGPDHLPVP
jgi:hypothetical protein